MDGMTINHIVSIDHGSYDYLDMFILSLAIYGSVSKPWY